ncbi:MAG: type II secretion system F family protein [Dehalococcoidia bacterium]|jgi:tight adherence protein C
MPLIAAASVFLTVFLLALSLRQGPKAGAVRARVATLSTSRAFEAREARPSFGDRVLAPLADALTGKALAVLPHGLLDRLKTRLLRAGEPVTAEGFILVSLAIAGAFGGLALLLTISAGAALDPKMLALIVLMTGVGAYLPSMWLSSRLRQRQATIVKSLPDSFDMITTCVEAGLGLDAALARVAEKVKGPFAEDLSITLREISMGRNRAESLRDLADRTGVTDLSLFVNAIIQAEQMGTSIGQVLRVQSEQMRVRRRQRAEERANQAPVKMVFPLVMCILPALFVVIMGPAAIQLYETLSNRG